MAIRKRKKNKTKRKSFKLVTSKKKKKQRRKTGQDSTNWTSTLKLLLGISLVAAVGFGLASLDKYVKRAVPLSQRIAVLKLVNPPSWANEALKEKIYAAATADGEDLKLDEDVAQSVQRNIETHIAWLDTVRVQATNDSIYIKARWRKPIALVKRGLRSFYVDAELVALDFIPMPNLPIVKVEGLPPITSLPRPGEVWQREDLAAAVAVLARLDRMDKLVTPDKPLLFEIGSIDISNFNGHQDTRFPHIVLYAKNKTEIIWGAEVGMWHRHLEAKDEDKLAMLYGFYEQNGTLLNGVKYINLRDPRGSVPLPDDKY